MGLNAINHQAIEAWSRLYHLEIGPWETSVIDALDRHYRSIFYQKKDPPKPTVQDAARDAADMKIAMAARAERRAARKKAREVNG